MPGDISDNAVPTATTAALRNDGPPAGNGLLAALAGLNTGAKLFLILSAALLPLALIAIYATAQTSRLANEEMQSRLHVATAEASRALAIELGGDTNALRVAVAGLEQAPHDLGSCARARGVFAEQMVQGVRFVMTDARGQIWCASNESTIAASPPRPGGGGATATIGPDNSLVIAIASPGGTLIATALYPRAFLAAVARPTGYMTLFAAELDVGGARLPLQQAAGSGPFDQSAAIRAPVGLADIALVMRARTVPLTSALIVAMVLPLMMWLAAIGISWLVVERVLIRPLRQLTQTVARYQPGKEIDPAIRPTIPAQEIRALSDTFRAISRTVIDHEAGLAEGLVRQTKLTREVHHRVKNNLQVISSLINFHARAAQSQDVLAAYALIQRRVDALAVVHRNHYAELEVNRGLNMRSVLGDLVSNLRATLPETLTGVTMTLDVEAVYTTQDIATPLCFLVTELVELAISVSPTASLSVGLLSTAGEDRAVLTVRSTSLAPSTALDELFKGRYGRVLEGLSRQLRTPLIKDAEGSYMIEFPIAGHD